MTTNIVKASFGTLQKVKTRSVYQHDYGQVLQLFGIELPTSYEVHFSNNESGSTSIIVIGDETGAKIPDSLLETGKPVYAWLFLHTGNEDGETVREVEIPVISKSKPESVTPTPHEQSVIEQAISALNDAVEATAADVQTTTANAQAAAQSEANAATSERSAAASAGAALASQNAAESASQSATESASGAAESARNAALSASTAAESATNAQESAEQAERSVQSIGDDVERAERAAQTATDKATEAALSASTASSKANEASASATAASQSAQSAASSATAAESSATDAEQAKQDAQTAQTAAETAQGKAEDAQAAAEAAAQSVSGLSAQISQNTADIAELVQSKAGVLVDTATGSIASFVPDATVPTVRGLTVDVEPVQSGSGYPSPDNIRPISGWDEVNVTVSPTTEAEDGRTYTIEMPTEAGTVYGGTVDAVNGVLTVDRAMFTFTGAESFIENTSAWGAYAKLYNTGISIISSVTNERTISSHFKKSSSGGWRSLVHGLFMTAGGTFIGIGFDGSISELKEYLADQYSNNQPVQVVAVLATPITIDLTPIEISVLTGQANNIWADSGDVSVEYAADLKTYIDQKIAAAVAALS